MAKKIDPTILERCAALGIKKVKTEDEAREKLLKILAENDIDGMEEEDTDSLLDMCESMVDTVEDEADDRTDDEIEADELADEEADDEVEDEAEDDSEDEAEDEPEEPKKPAKKEEKKVAKKEEKKPAKKEDKKTEKPAEKKKIGKRGIKVDPKNNKDDRKAFKVLERFFPTDKYEYCWIVTNGVTIKYKGKNSSRAIISIDSCSRKENGEITGNLYLPTFAKSLETLDNADIEYEIAWNGTPFIRAAKFSELDELLEEFLEQMEEFVGKIDKRLGDNRQKMEDNLKKTTKQDKVKKTVKKQAEPEVEDEADDEVEDEEPAKKPAKKAAKKEEKKAAKKAKK